MNKQELLEFVNALPDDMEVEPLNYESLAAEPQAPEWSPSIGNNYTACSHYRRKVDRRFTLVVRCQTETEADFERTAWGSERWFNVKRIK